MEICKLEHDKYFILQPKSQLDGGSSSEFDGQIEEHLKVYQKPIVLDMANVRYVSSAGLRSMLIMAKTMQKSNLYFVICNLQENVLQVFDIAGFLNILNYKSSVDDAVSCICKSSTSSVKDADSSR